MLFLLLLLMSAVTCVPTPLVLHISPNAAPSASAAHATLLRDGFLHLPELIPADEALAWGRAVDAAANARAADCSASALGRKCEPSPPPGAPASFLRARDLAATDAGLAVLTHSPALARVVASALRVKGLRYYESSAFIKHSGDERSRWHSDAAAIPLRTDKIATLWLSLSDVDADAGALKFLNASHLPGVPRPSLRDVPVFERPLVMAEWADATDAAVRAATGLDVVRARAMRAGDATLHLGWTLHAASRNKSPHDRVALAITYFVDGARIDDVLESQRSGEGDARGGIRFSGDGGSDLIVHLLADDVSTWTPWIHERVLIPGTRMEHERLTPLLFGGKLGDL